MKLGTVRKGWSLQTVLSVRVEAARFNKGKLTYFEPSVMGANGVVTTAGGWRGGAEWPSNPVPGPWGLPGVV